MDKDIAVVEKPAGIAVETGRISEMDLVNMVKNHIFREKGIKDPGLYMVHRLDQPVRGLIVFAQNKGAAAKLSRQIKEADFSKGYYAAVEGIVKNKEPTLLEDYLIKDKGNTARIVSKEVKNAKKAVLKYKVIDIDEDSDISLLYIELMTGRFHQIRAQLSNLGHPIAGDVKYGAEKIKVPVPKGTIGLCACHLGFYHPVSKKRLEFDLGPEYKPEDRHLHKSGIFYTIL